MSTSVVMKAEKAPVERLPFATVKYTSRYSRYELLGGRTYTCIVPAAERAAKAVPVRMVAGAPLSAGVLPIDPVMVALVRSDGVTVESLPASVIAAVQRTTRYNL